MKKKLVAFMMAATMMLFALAACSPTQTSEPAATTTPEQAEAAEKDLSGSTVKVLLAYGGAEKSFEEFTKETGIKVEFLEISTGKALAQIQAANGVSDADVWFGGGVDSYISAKELDYLAPITSKEGEAIPSQYKDAEGYWTGLALVPAGFLVNKDVLAEKGLEAPTTWEDLADPQYKGEIIMASPAISGTQYAILNGLIQALGEEKGWDLWKRIDANMDSYAQGGGEPGPKTSAGEYAIGVLAITGGTYELQNQFPVEVVVPTDYIPWTPAPIGLFKDAKNPEAAQAMVNYYLSKKGQEVLLAADARIMAREDVAVPEVMKTLDTTKLIKQDVSLFGSQREELLKKWEEMVGTK